MTYKRNGKRNALFCRGVWFITPEMAKVIFFLLCCICSLLLESASSLKCRTGVQQTDDQFRKVVQICKKRHTGDDGDFSSEEDDDDGESSSDSNILNKLFMKNGDSSGGRSGKDQDDWFHGNDRRNNNQQRSSFNNTNGSWRNTQYSSHGGSNSNNRDFGHFDASGRDQMYNNYNFGNQKEREKACIVQCFFNELNAVDHGGFPEPQSVVQLMTFNVQNPELRDFMQEAVIECYHYLSTDPRADKCLFSQNLLSCLADKGKERCDDW